MKRNLAACAFAFVPNFSEYVFAKNWQNWMTFWLSYNKYNRGWDSVFGEGQTTKAKIKATLARPRTNMTGHNKGRYLPRGIRLWAGKDRGLHASFSPVAAPGPCDWPRNDTLRRKRRRCYWTPCLPRSAVITPPTSTKVMRQYAESFPFYSPGGTSNLRVHVFVSEFDPKSPLPLEVRDPKMCYWTPQVYLPNGV